MFGFKRRQPETDQFLVLQERYFPRITKTQQAAAMKRLAIERDKYIMIDWGEGPQPFYTGTIDLQDARAESGYHVMIGGYDRFGWPEGHPDSPAS